MTVEELTISMNRLQSNTLFVKKSNLNKVIDPFEFLEFHIDHYEIEI